MKVLNIHGYKGSSENSACITLKNLGHEVISPQIDYDSKRPHRIFADLRDIFYESRPDYIVGTGLGGFFALLLSRKFTVEEYESHRKRYFYCNIPTVLVNPCLNLSVLSELGYKMDKSRKMTFVRFMDMIEKTDCRNVVAIIGGQDEIINYHRFTESLIKKCYVVPDGKHSGATLNLDYWLKRFIK
ncbi:MAG: hypothetical protein K2J40_04615 [Ruminococcus sp.]|nr:hypothetical protein [Ruminococcus sp.]